MQDGLDPIRPGKFRLPFSFALEHLVARLGDAFEQQNDFVQAAAVPLRVFFFRDANHIRKILAEPAADAKCPLLLLRVKWVMRGGAYILPGGDAWKQRRAYVQPAFKRARLVRYVDELPPLIRETTASWRDLAAKGVAFDICKHLQILITRFSFRMLFSKDLTDAEAEHLAELTHYINVNFVKPAPLAWPLPAHLRFKKSWTELRAVFLDEIVRRRASGEQREDVLATLLGAPEGQNLLSDDDIADEMASVYFGASVMSTTLSWMIFLISTHQSIQERLIESLSALPRDREVAESDLNSLEYVQMIVQETLRLYPPSWVYPRISKEKFVLDGFEIPKNSLLMPAVYHVHRNERYWTEPFLFNPERFHPESKQRIPAGAYLPFGRGPRLCLGSVLAPFVLQMTLAALFRQWRFSFVREGSETDIDFGFEIHPKGQIRVLAAAI